MQIQQKEVDFAVKLAITGGKNTVKYFKKDILVSQKSDKSPVTEADKETESLMRQLIRAQYPDHGIIGEEEGSEETTSRFCWVIDPIDGTKSFIHQIPLYTVLVALLVDHKPMVGVIYQPVLDELVWAAVGMGCFYNGKPTSIRPCKSLKDAWLHTTDTSDLLRTWPKSVELLNRCGYSRTWGDGYGYLLVASGRADLMVDAKVNFWDVACVEPIITEAGGMISDLQGNKGLGSSCIAGNPVIVKEALELLT